MLNQYKHRHPRLISLDEDWNTLMMLLTTKGATAPA